MVVDLLQQVVLELVCIDLGGGEQCKQVRDAEHVGQHDEVLELHGLVSEQMPADRVLLWEPLGELGLQLFIRLQTRLPPSTRLAAVPGSVATSTPLPSVPCHRLTQLRGVIVVG